jgi:ATP-dependent Lon protease
MSGHTPLPSTLIELPMLPLRDVVVFPHMVIPLVCGPPQKHQGAGVGHGR